MTYCSIGYKIYTLISLSLSSLFVCLTLIKVNNIVDSMKECTTIWWILIGNTILSMLTGIGMLLYSLYSCFCSVIGNDSKASFSLTQCFMLMGYIFINVFGFIIPFTYDDYYRCRDYFNNHYHSLYLGYMIYLITFTINVTWFILLATCCRVKKKKLLMMRCPPPQSSIQHSNNLSLYKK